MKPPVQSSDRVCFSRYGIEQAALMERRGFSTLTLLLFALVLCMGRESHKSASNVLVGSKYPLCAEERNFPNSDIGISWLGAFWRESIRPSGEPGKSPIKGDAAASSISRPTLRAEDLLSSPDLPTRRQKLLVRKVPA
jgi:hypothetical protein